MREEMNAFAAVFEKYEVEVFRPEVLQDCNQIFSRDIAFVIENKLILANILPDREKEIELFYMFLIKYLKKILFDRQKKYMLKVVM